MSSGDVFTQWEAGQSGSFGPLTQAILATQNQVQFASVGIVFTQAFMRALVNAATNNGVL